MKELLEIPQVIDAVIAHDAGEEITEEMKGLLAQITLRVLGTADNLESLKNLIELIEKHVNILSDQDENLLLPGLEFEDILKDIEIL